LREPRSLKLKSKGSEQTEGWREGLDRAELHLVRKQVPELQATQRATQGGQILRPPQAKHAAKDKRRRRANANNSRSEG